MFAWKSAMALAVSLGLAAPAMADPTLGVGLSFSFGGGSGVNTGLGLRLFSDNEEDSFVGAIGMDYMFGKNSWRGTLGGAYLGNNSYVGLDLGIGLSGGGLDFGVGAGLADTESPAQPDSGMGGSEIPEEG